MESSRKSFSKSNNTNLAIDADELNILKTLPRETLAAVEIVKKVWPGARVVAHYPPKGKL